MSGSWTSAIGLVLPAVAFGGIGAEAKLNILYYVSNLSLREGSVFKVEIVPSDI